MRVGGAHRDNSCDFPFFHVSQGEKKSCHKINKYILAVKCSHTQICFICLWFLTAVFKISLKIQAFLLKKHKCWIQMYLRISMERIQFHHIHLVIFPLFQNFLIIGTIKYEVPLVRKICLCLSRYDLSQAPWLTCRRWPTLLRLVFRHDLFLLSPNAKLPLSSATLSSLLSWRKKLLWIGVPKAKFLTCTLICSKLPPSMRIHV